MKDSQPAWAERSRDKSRQAETRKTERWETGVGKRRQRECVMVGCEGKYSDRQNQQSLSDTAQKGKRQTRTLTTLKRRSPSRGGIWGCCDDKPPPPVLALNRVSSSRWDGRQTLGSPKRQQQSGSLIDRRWEPRLLVPQRRGTRPGSGNLDSWI